MGIAQKDSVPVKQAHGIPWILVNVSFVKPQSDKSDSNWVNSNMTQLKIKSLTEVCFST